MRNISIFLASSKELEYDRIVFGDYILGLQHIFEPQGFHLDLEKWEFVDAAMQDGGKQNQYNEKLKKCQIVVALFHTRAGKYTQEELNLAWELYKEKGLPSVYIFMKELKEGETETPELEELKGKIVNEWKHFYDSYGHLDTLKFKVLQNLLHYLNKESLKLEIKDSTVKLGNEIVAPLSNLPFVANNETYNEWNGRIAELEEEIAELEEDLTEKANPKKEERLGKKRTELYNLKERLSKLEQDLFATAQKLASLQSEAMNERLRKAKELFKNGDNKGADAILEMKDIDQDIEQIYGNRGSELELTKKTIAVLTFKAQNLLTLYDNKNRFDEAEKCYAKAYGVARKVHIEDSEMIEFLGEYHHFLAENARNKNIIAIGEEWLRLTLIVSGEEATETATAYNNIGGVYDSLGDYDKALKYYEKALEISEKVLGVEHPSTAISYNNIGAVYDDLGDYDKALENHEKALGIREKVLGVEHPDTAISYNNIGEIYRNLGEHDKALENHKKTLEIFEKVLGVEHPHTASSYNNLGLVYTYLGDYDKALEYNEKALEIREKVLGAEHPSTATSYNNIGGVYKNLGEYEKALEYYEKALEIREKVLGEKHPLTATTYWNIGNAYGGQGEMEPALTYIMKAAKAGHKVAQQLLSQFVQALKKE